MQMLENMQVTLCYSRGCTNMVMMLDWQDARVGAALTGAGSAELSSALDTISRLKRQLAERDKEIFELRVRVERVSDASTH